MKEKILLILFSLAIISCKKEMSTTYEDIFEIKFGSTPHYNFGNNMLIKTSDGKYVVVYFSNHNMNGKQDVFLRKIDTDGTIIWEKSYPNECSSNFVYFVDETEDNGFIIGGSKGNVNNWVSTTGMVIKTDSEGNVLWQKEYGIGYEDQINIIRQMPDGNLFLLGNNYDDLSDDILIKTDPQGDTIWTKQLDHILPNAPYSNYINMINTTDNNLIIVGENIIKMDQNGELLWSCILGDKLQFKTTIHSIIEKDDKSFIALGKITNGINYMLVKISKTGEVIWSKKLDYEKCCNGHGLTIRTSTNENFIICGTNETSNGDVIQLSEFDQNGKLNWEMQKDYCNTHLNQAISFINEPNNCFIVLSVGLDEINYNEMILSKFYK